MLRKIDKKSMGVSNLGWLESRFHFSFAEYRDPQRMNFGVLRVLNDDIIHPQGGFGMHPHHDMEIVSYVVDGEITHKDSLGNSETLQRYDVQFMTAGTGIVHSEYNMNSDQALRLLQLWIFPQKKKLPVNYGSHRYTKEQMYNQLLKIVSSVKGDSPVKINQDVSIFVSELEQGKSLVYEIQSDRQIYYVQIEGVSKVNELTLDHGDALEVVEEKLLKIYAQEHTHLLFVEMADE